VDWTLIAGVATIARGYVYVNMATTERHRKRFAAAGMTLDQLRVFVAVAEHQHLTRAANSLALSQSAVSSSIASLESRYEIRLFDRIGRNISLNSSGRLFLDEARGVLARAAVAQGVLSDLAGLKRGSLSLAASQTVSNYWLPRVMRDFHQKYPDIDVSLSITNTEQVGRRVVDGIVELGFVEDHVEIGGLSVTAVEKDQLLLVVAPGHVWAGRESISADVDLHESSWVLRERGSGTRRMFEKTVINAGVEPASLDVLLELPSNEAVRSAVEWGMGATVLSSLVVASSIQAGMLVAVPWNLPARDFLMLRHEQRYETEAMRAFGLCTKK
jgi:DNA-binding transcriptional LysR family regulator